MLTNGECPQAARALNPSAPIALQHDAGQRIWCLSIRHTGTHYCFEQLRSLGYVAGRPNWGLRRLEYPRFPANYFVHSHIEITPTYEFLASEPCVMPLRNPIEVYRSHVYRYAWQAGQVIDHLLHAFELFDSLAAAHDAFIFQVDAEDQPAELAKLAAWLDVDDYEYREISRTMHGTRGEGICRNRELFTAPPPSEITKLAKSYGY